MLLKDGLRTFVNTYTYTVIVMVIIRASLEVEASSGPGFIFDGLLKMTK